MISELIFCIAGLFAGASAAQIFQAVGAPVLVAVLLFTAVVVYAEAR